MHTKRSLNQSPENRDPKRRKLGETLYEIPSATALYQKFLSEQKAYRLISKKTPQQLEIELSEIDNSITYELIQKIEPHYWDYLLSVPSLNEDIINQLDAFKYEVFQEAPCIPLKEFTFNYNNYRFKQDEAIFNHQQFLELEMLPLDYRAEATYLLILKVLHQETSASHKPKWLFNAKLVFNAGTSMGKISEEQSVNITCDQFIDELRDTICPNDYIYQSQVAQRSMPPYTEKPPYKFSPLPLCFLELSSCLYWDPNYVILAGDAPKNDDIFSKDTRAVFSYLQYTYLLELHTLALKPLNLQNVGLSQNKSSFFNDAAISSYTLICHEKEKCLAHASIFHHLPLNTLYQTIIDDIHETITKSSPNLLKLCWLVKEEGLQILPITMRKTSEFPQENIGTTGGFSREVALAIQKKYLTIFKDHPNLHQAIHRCRYVGTESSQNCYFLQITNQGLDYLATHYALDEEKITEIIGL